MSSAIDCVHRHRAIGQYNLSGQIVDVFECLHYKSECSPSKLDGLKSCIGCAAQITAAQAADCVHRGPKLRDQNADLCGLKGVVFSVHSCAIHGECSLLKYCRNQAVHSCASCDDKQEISLALKQ